MKILVLGGLGLQGRATLRDLVCSDAVDRVICADIEKNAAGITTLLPDLDKVRFVEVDATSKNALVDVLGQDIEVAIDLLPRPLMRIAFEAALEAGVSMVSTNYGHDIQDLHARAIRAGVSLLPECGLDPGIDLVICGHAVRQFERVQVLKSYCGGFPEKKACDNPLNYKITWNWDMVLASQMRESIFIKDGKRVLVPAEDQHDNDMIHGIDFEGLGRLEAVPNGDAVFYTDLLGLTETIEETGRYALRWPGWCAFWRPLKRLGFFSEKPMDMDGCLVSGRQFLKHFMGPRLQYGMDEKDIVAMLNVFEGFDKGRKKSVTTKLLIERDLLTGLFAMNLGVGYPVSIVAQMIGRGEITKGGVLSPVMDVPYEPFMQALAERGIVVEEDVTYNL